MKEPSNITPAETFVAPAYDDVRKLVDTGDRLSCHGFGPFSKVIRKFTGDYMNHEAMIIRYNEFAGEGVDIVDVIEAVKDGFMRQPFSQWLANYNGEVFLHLLKSEFIDKRSALGREALVLRGTPYDFEDCTRCAFGRVNADAAKMFCSEALFIIGKNAGLPLPAGMERIAPVPGRQVDLLGWYDPFGRIR